jgi:hypothetical protein
MNDKGLSDLDLARRLLDDVTGDSAMKAFDSSGLIAKTVEAWLAHQVMEAHRYYGDPEVWRSYRTRVQGITAAVRALLESPAPSPAARTAGPVPAQEAQWQNDGIEHWGGLTKDELDAIPVDKWHEVRERLGIGVRPAGVLD